MSTNVLTNRIADANVPAAEQLRGETLPLPPDQKPTTDSIQTKTLVSFVIPVMNEEETLYELREGIAKHTPADYDLEIIFVDDGSTDDSWSVIRSLADVYPSSCRGVRFRNNVGKASALTAGFRAARGSYIVTMDADLQDDPAEIPRFIEKLNSGFDLISGYKRKRHDPWHKVLPSRVFNWMLSRISRVPLHDHNCGFKCYRREVADRMTLYGELHRMVPPLAGMFGFRIGEVVVEHHPRKSGVSKYGVERFLRGFSDMLTIGVMRRYRERPSHFANKFAFAYMAAAMGLAISSPFFGITTVQGVLAIVGAMVLASLGGLSFLCGLFWETLVRGGNGNDWKLPVVEDTSVRAAPDDESTVPPMQPIPTEYCIRPIIKDR